MNDLASLLKQQMEGNIARDLDAAVLAGDTAAARKMAKQFADLQVAAVPATPTGKKPPTPAEIKKVLETKVTWFGVDPRKTSKIMELGRMMDPTRFETPEAFADQLVKFYNEEEKKPAGRGASTEDENAEDEDAEDENAEDKDAEDENAEDEDAEPVRGVSRKRKNGTPTPELSSSRGSVASNLRTAFQTGDIKHLPRASAEEIRKSADKFALKGDDKVRAKFIKNAVIARARSELIAAGKFDPRTNALKK